ncbi:hypothetical protein GQ607_008285 [Colletotrichum asianum]|uniref:Uncharacterized protein n=1 Tax=Colletotrichum asianum TaxID=702518 RepID=A0A8H3ZSF9_9PEZI|nr:hypothetical protein GQ607_008285 [Colletotrichum asianum]
MQMQYDRMSEIAVEDMDYVNDFDDGVVGAYHDTEEVVLTFGSGGLDEINGGSGRERQPTATTTTLPRKTPGPGHRRRRSSFLVSHGVSSFWYGLCSVVLLVLVLVSTRPAVAVFPSVWTASSITFSP